MSSKKTTPRYAKALFSCGSSMDEKLMQSQVLNALSLELKIHEDAAQYFENPFVSLEEKKNTLKKGLGPQPDMRLLSFLELLIKSKRFQDLQGISFEFQNLLNESRNTADVTLVFAEAMDAKTKDLFKEKLEKHFKKKLEITEKIDPSILGGFILIISGKIIDLSIKGKLSSLKDHLFSQKV